MSGNTNKESSTHNENTKNKSHGAASKEAYNHSDQRQNNTDPPNWVDKGVLVVLACTLIAAIYAGFEAKRLADLTETLVTSGQVASKQQAADTKTSLELTEKAANAAIDAAKAAQVTADATLKAANAAKEAVTLSRENAERQLRAYVFVDASQINGLTTTEPLVAMFRIKNFGQTPAKNILAGATIYIGDGGPFSAPIQKLPGMLSPTGEMLLSLDAIQPLTQIQFNDIVAGRETIFIRGEITYTDVFGVKRYTRFSQYFRGNGTLLSVSSVLALSNTQDGNDYK